MSSGKVARMAKNYIVNSNRFNFADVVHEALQANWMNTDVIPAMNKAVDQVSKEAARKLRNTSPGHGDYAKGWAVQKERGRLTTEATVYGKKPTYRLAHLLEKSHVMRNGKRSKPIVHIEPVADWAQTEAINRMYELLEKSYR